MKYLLTTSAILICLSINSYAHEDHDHSHDKQEPKAAAAPSSSPAPKKEAHAHDHSDHQHDHNHSHDHSQSNAPQRVITEAQALGVAIGASKHLTTKDAGLPFGLLPASWATLNQDKAAISEKGEGYYIVSVKNEEEKKTLFLLIGTNGNVYDANFTGLFKGLQKP